MAKLKEDTKARIEAERQELKIAQRLQQMQAIRPECQRPDVEFLLVDDPVKDYAAAHSAVDREALWNW